MNAADQTKTIDPVCGMTVDPAKAAGKFDLKGQTYYFCSSGCLKKFQANPDPYLQRNSSTSAVDPQLISLGGLPSPSLHSARPTPQSQTSASSRYTCPMHPEIIRDGPGSCPICGMALEPVTVAAEEAPNVELVDMTRRFWTSVVLTAPLLVLAMIDMLPGMPMDQWVGPAGLRWVELALATPVVVWCGWPFFIRFWQSLVYWSPNMFTLIAVGTGGIRVQCSCHRRAQLFPESIRNEHGRVDVYFESAAVIITLVLLGQVLELRARGQTSSAIRALLD